MSASLVEWWESEQRVIRTTEMAAIYARAQQEAVEALGRIVLAAGGEVRVPDRLVVADVTISVDVVNGETVYRARLGDDQ